MADDESASGKDAKNAALNTHAAPIFVENAEDLVRRLTPDQSAVAQGMLREARELAARFRRWEIERPPNEVRVAAIQQLFAVSRRVRDYLSRGERPPPADETTEGFLKRLFKKKG